MTDPDGGIDFGWWRLNQISADGGGGESPPNPSTMENPEQGQLLCSPKWKKKEEQKLSRKKNSKNKIGKENLTEKTKKNCPSIFFYGLK